MPDYESGHRDSYTISLEQGDFTSGQLSVLSFIQPNRLFTVKQSVVLNTAAQLTRMKFDEMLAKLRQLFP